MKLSPVPVLSRVARNSHSACGWVEVTAMASPSTWKSVALSKVTVSPPQGAVLSLSSLKPTVLG